MKTIIIATVLSAIAAGGALADTYDIVGFSKVNAAAGISVTVTAGQEFAIVGEAKRGNIRRLQITKSGDELYIDRKTGWGLMSWFRNDKFVVAVSMPKIEGASAASGSTIILDADGAIGFEGHAYSGASLRVDELGGGEIELSSSSGASLSAAGDCGDLDASASSGASLMAADLACESADFEASSGASLSLYATQTISGKASSGASVKLRGDASVREVSTNSGASVSGG